jgi:hypothetical protein
MILEQKNQGEAIGGEYRSYRDTNLSFYTGKPPTVLGGSNPLLVFIRPLLIFKREICYSRLGYV